jgi:peptidoglycan/xylan/chitin deacetylase (PgdA/CDA1 family)
MKKASLLLTAIAAAGLFALSRGQDNPSPAPTPPALAATNAPAADAPTNASADAATAPEPEPTLPANFHRDKPPYIVIKTDDLKCLSGDRLPPNWDTLADDLKKRHIKAGIGIICDSLEGDSPKYFQWIKDLQATGLVELWFHAYDHLAHITNGLAYGEMDGRSYDDLKQRFAKSQQLAMTKLGFNFHTFGPPGGSPVEGAPQASPANPHSTADLDRVLQEDPDMTAYLYPKPIDDDGKKLEAQGKITILDRVWRVNIEQPLFKPSYAKFVDGYGRYPQREYFVIQGHPGHWKGDGYAQFDKILDFLQAQNAVFVTPTEMAGILRKEAGGAAP